MVDDAAIFEAIFRILAPAIGLFVAAVGLIVTEIVFRKPQ